MRTSMLPKLDLNITNRCNFRCAHCAFDSGVRNLEEMPVAAFERILTDTRSLGGQRIDITGGEPTIRQDLEEIVCAAKKLGFAIELVTNGSLLDAEKIHRLIELGVDSMAISLDGASFEQHTRIRRISREQYTQVLKNISRCVALGLKTKINTLVTAANLCELPQLVELAIAAGACEHGLYYFTPVGRGRAALEHSVEPRTWLRFIREQLMRYVPYIKLSVEVALLEGELAGPHLGCIALTEPYHLQILPDGNVYPCAILAAYRRPLANLNRTEVRDIWQNESLWTRYAETLKREVLTNNCGSCVGFSNFYVADYLQNGFSFVCPLRKFSVEQLLLPLIP